MPPAYQGTLEIKQLVQHIDDHEEKREEMLSQYSRYAARLFDVQQHVHLKHLTYIELGDFTAEESPAAVQRRSALFADQTYSPNLWSTCEALLAPGRNCQLSLRRGRPAPPPTAPAVALKPSTPAQDTPCLASFFKTMQSSRSPSRSAPRSTCPPRMAL
ncbi:hypothetical protein BD311DRAFT_679356 [Dichomitus squalens]|uniref:Uncharacterized protein n=1 Tax=Dichomitus squalens TaxID=114155 RepID=A0A4Q9M301_9APHY|nr:hypothetical protein BD311DRAFT_679356 [Dichomitus squalens]